VTRAAQKSGAHKEGMGVWPAYVRKADLSKYVAPDILKKGRAVQRNTAKRLRPSLHKQPSMVMPFFVFSRIFDCLKVVVDVEFMFLIILVFLGVLCNNGIIIF